MLTTVNVTRKNINEAGCSSTRCPVARAIRPLMRSDVYFYVYSTRCEVEDASGNNQSSMSMPKEVRRFIKSFDNNEDVQPFTFQIDIPDHLLRVAPNGAEETP
jgi:hypothetical protein